LDPNGLEERLLRDATSYPALFASLMEHFAAAQGKPRWGEKSPQHSLFTETLCEWFPGAAIIHLVRDPREVVASLQLVPWASNSVITNAITWRRYNQAARRSSHRPEYLMVHYHDLVNHPERELRRICSLLGEEYSPAACQDAGLWHGPSDRIWRVQCCSLGTDGDDGVSDVAEALRSPSAGVCKESSAGGGSSSAS
jgi:hypothetical protein